MNKEEKILKFIKVGIKKISLDTKIFMLNIDSFEFVKLVAQVQIIVKNIFLIFQKIFEY